MAAQRGGVTEKLNAYEYVARNPLAKVIGRQNLKNICADYHIARKSGVDHDTARKFALQSYSSIWIMLAWAALQVIFYLLKQWWEKRQPDAHVHAAVL